MGLRGGEGDVGDEADKGADKTDVAAMHIYILIWLEHNRNRLYGAMGVLSKKSDGWVTGWSGYPLDCCDY